MVKANRRRRRLMVIALALVVLAVGAGVSYLVLKHQRQQRFLAMRDAGGAAFAAGDYETALRQLSSYCGRHSSDADALLQLAESRRRVEAPNSRHLVEAAGIYRRVLHLRPERLDILREVMRLHDQLGFRVEAVDAATRLLEGVADDPEAVRIRARGLVALRRNAEALPFIEAAVKRTPLDIELQLLLLGLYHDASARERILPHAEALWAAHPDDGRAELLLAAACHMAEAPAEAVASLRRALQQRYPDAPAAADARPDAALIAIGQFLLSQAAQRPLDDLSFARTLIGQLEQARRPLAARDALLRAVERHDDPDLRLRLVHRLFELSDLAELEKRTAALPPNPQGAWLQVVALRGVALVELGRKEEARPLADLLAGRTDEPLALAWATVLREAYLSDAPDRRRLIAAIRPAVDRQRNGYLLTYLGNVYLALEERELARQAYQEAAAASTLWPVPVSQLAQLLVEQREFVQAAEAAQYAAMLIPNAVTLPHLATIWAASVDRARLHQHEALVQLVGQIQSQAPGEPRTLPLHVLILAQSGRTEDAARAIRQALEREQCPEPVLLALAAVSREEKLGLEEACHARSEQLHGLTPALAVARAASGVASHALQRLEEDIARQPQPLALSWRVTWARELDRAGDPRAAEAVRALADDPALAGDLGVQRLALAARSVQEDRALLDRTIERIRAATGDESTGWRLARARVLGRPEATETDAREIVQLLTPLATAQADLEVRQRLGSAHERLGNVPAAIEQFSAALKLQPDSSRFMLALAMLHQSSADYARVREQLERIRPEELSDAQCRQLAWLLVQQGQAGRALALYQQRPSMNVAGDRFMVAILHEQQNEPERADAIYRDLLRSPDLPVVVSAARFFAATGRPQEAEKVLALLGALKLPPGQEELVRAEHYARLGDAPRAIAHARAATELTPANAAAWRVLVLQCLQVGQIEEVLKHLAAAASAAPADKGLARLARDQKRLKLLAERPATRALVMAAVADSTGAEVIGETLAVVAQIVNDNPPAIGIVERLRPLAERAPQLAPLQILLMQACLDASRPQDAVTVADRTMRFAPASPDAVALAVRVRAAARDWPQVLNLSQRWRELTPANPLAADQFIAEALLRLQQPAAATRQLEPHMAAARAKPQEGIRVLAQQARIWVESGQASRAQELIRPLAQQSAEYRRVWMDLAASAVTPPAQAAAWLTQAESFPVASAAEQVALANAWHALSVRTGDNQHLQRGRAYLDRLAAPADAPLEIVFTQAWLANEDKDHAAAEAAYRRLLKAHPDNAGVRNNLAMVLLEGKGSADEAVALAAAAVEKEPNLADFHDTLAQAHAARKDWAAAIAAIDAASGRSPNDPRWLVRLGTYHAEAGQAAEAGRVLQEFARRFPDEGQLDEKLRGQLAALRARISAAQTR